MTNSSYVLDVPATPAIIEWVDTGGRTRYLHDNPQPLDRILFGLYFDTSSNTSFFKLCIPIITKPVSKKGTPIYLYIPPERVATLVAECSDVPKVVGEQLGTDVIRLRFDLNKPADLITPQFQLFPKKKFYQDTLYVSATLAKQLAITIYISRPSSEEQLRLLCDAVSLREVSFSENHANLGALYRSKGGRVCTNLDTLIQQYAPKTSYSADDGPSGSRQQDSPLTADIEVPPYIPSPLTAGSSFGDNSRKRRRFGSDDGVDTDGTDADKGGAHANAFRRLGAETYGDLERRLDVMNEEMQVTKRELLETKHELQATRLELQATRQATNRKFQATIKELLATRKLSQAMRESLRDAKRSTKHKLRATTQTANRILRESNRELQVATQELQATKQELRTTKNATGQRLFEVRARIDQEVMRLNRLLGHTVELLLKTQSKTDEVFKNRQYATEENLREVIQLLKGLMNVVSRMIRHEDGSPAAEAFMAGGLGRTIEMTTGTTGTTSGTTNEEETGSGQAQPPQPSCTAASNADLVPPSRGRHSATTGTTDFASSRPSRSPGISTNDLDGSSTDSGSALPVVPPPRPLPFPVDINRAESSTDRSPTSPFPKSIPYPRVLPLPTTANPAESSTDNGPACASPGAGSVPPPSVVADDAFDSSDSL